MSDKKKIKLYLNKTLLLVGLCFVLIFNPAFAEIPPGFRQVKSAEGVTLYKKSYYDKFPDFVQVIDLTLGASVKLLHGPIEAPGIGEGSYGGDNPTFKRQTLNKSWAEFSSSYPNAFSITNGQFFVTNMNPTPLAFPIKVDEYVISEGYGKNEFPNQKLMLEIWSDHADIREFDEFVLYSSSAPNIIVGLTENADKGIYRYTGRTFVGIDDDDNDGINEKVLVFNSRKSTQIQAAKVLRDFGADKVMMLDGGGSTQLICDGKNYIRSNRRIPQMIGVLSSKSIKRLIAISIKGLDRVNENSYADYTATADFSDGSSQIVNDLANWRENSRFAYMDRNLKSRLITKEVPRDKRIRITVIYSYEGVTRKAHKYVKIIDKPSLASIKIIGPLSVEENFYANYKVRAKFSNGSKRWVTYSAIWSENSPYTQMHPNIKNRLITGEVPSNQVVKITAAYTYSGVTRNASKNVTITDILLPPFSVVGENPTTRGWSYWDQPLLVLSGTISGTNLTLTVTKIGGTPWETSGKVYFKVGTYEPWGFNRKIAYTEKDKTVSVPYTHDLAKYSGQYPKEFYVRYEPYDGGWAWVGPITVVENNN